MADRMVFSYPKMEAAVTELENLAQKYKKAGHNFETAFVEGINGWEGLSKQKMEHFNQEVKEYVEESIPALIHALSALLKSNIDQMKNVDKQIAESIPSSLYENGDKSAK